MKTITGNVRQRWVSAILAVAAVLVLAGTAMADSTSILVAPAFVTAAPGGEVYLFKVHGTDPLQPVPAPPGKLVYTAGSAFDQHGELFMNVVGDAGNPTDDRVARFLMDAQGTLTPNGSISGNGVDFPHGIAFSPWGELFVGNIWAGTISRFTFDAAGNAIPNGTIRVGQEIQGLAFSSSGELFVGEYRNSRVSRFVFDADRNATPSGTIPVPVVPGALNLLGEVGFSEAGELFVTKGGGRVYRFLFDASGHATSNGYISAAGAGGFAFSPEGELFVVNHLEGGIHRFLFDAAGNAVPNGFTDTVERLHYISMRRADSLTLSKTLLSGCLKTNAKLTLGTPAPAGGVTVALHSDNLNAIVPASLFLKEGATTKSFSILTSAVASNETATIEASALDWTLSAALTLKPMGPKSVTLTPSPVVGGTTVAGLVTLECPAGPGDIEVALTSTKAFIAEPTTDTILIPVGTQSLPFEVRTTPVFAPVDVTVKATANEVTKSRKLTMTPVP